MFVCGMWVEFEATLHPFSRFVKGHKCACLRNMLTLKNKVSFTARVAASPKSLAGS